jgi:hypothetical protein
VPGPRAQHGRRGDQGRRLPAAHAGPPLGELCRRRHEPRAHHFLQVHAEILLRGNAGHEFWVHSPRRPPRRHSPPAPAAGPLAVP